MNDHSLPHSTPEAQGIRSAAISAFVAAAEQQVDSLHSFMLLRHGHIVAQGWWYPYLSDDQHVLFSLSKSFTSSAIGMLVAEGRLSVDDPVVSFFPDDAPPEPTDNLAAMQVRHLLAMSTGHDFDTTGPMTHTQDKTWVQAFLAMPVAHEPGTHFLYNTGATYILSAIVHKLTGGRMLDYLRPRLFEPLGIHHPRWDQSPQGIDVGGWGLWLTTADIAAFGQLYLQKGAWQGQQLLPEAWIDEATSLQTPNGSTPTNDWEQGYGYQFWMCRHGAYRGDGAFGQYCVVLPAQDAVLVMTSGLENMQVPLDLVWEHLLPAMHDEPLAEDLAPQYALADATTQLYLPLPPGKGYTSTANRVSGKRFAMQPNDLDIIALTFDFASDATTVTVERSTGTEKIAFGHDRWLRDQIQIHPGGETHLHPQNETWRIAAGGSWSDERTFAGKIWWYETPFAQTSTFQFQANHLVVAVQMNVGFVPPEPITLAGDVE